MITTLTMETTKGGQTMFYNEYTKQPYQGKNVEILEKTGFKGGFLTFNQAFKMGGIIPKGTKAIAKLTKPVIDLQELKDGSLQEKISGRKFSVFHISQIQFEDKGDA